MNGFLRAGGIFGARKDDDIGSSHRGNWFAHRTGWKQRLAADWARSVHQHDIEIASQLQVLEAVVKKKNVHWLTGFDQLALGMTIFPNSEDYVILQARTHELDFITRACGAPVAASENGNTLALKRKAFRQPNDQRRFAGSADRKVTYTDDRTL